MSEIKPRIIYYYQTLTSLKPILTSKTVTHIHLSSIHFGFDSNQEPYIHLNDLSPYDSKFESVWKELFIATQNNIDVRLMVGGAGTAYQKLFDNWEIFYPMLIKLINLKSNIIQGIDLDIEETVNLADVKILITKLKQDLGNGFKISMAPIQMALQNDIPGIGGFCYKDLYSSEYGKYIEYFNTQFYMSYSVEAYDAVVENGYPEEKVVMGMIMGPGVENNYTVVEKLKEEYGNNFGGVFIWEYSGAPSDWSPRMFKILRNVIS